jgi:hypothetical protein
MAFFLDTSGNAQHVQLTASIYKAAYDANMSVPQYINKMYAKDCDQSKGTPFQQLCASEGLSAPGKNPYGMRAPTLADVLDGKSGFQAAGGANTSDRGDPFGSASRILFPAAIVTMIESAMDKDRVTDGATFEKMIAMDLSIGNENFEQPVVNYGTPGGPEQTRSQRIAQLAEPPQLLKFTTSDRIRKLPTWSIGAEFSDQALRASTLDVVAMTLARYWEVEKDAHVYEYMNDVFNGDGDLNVGAVSAVTAASLDATSTTMANFTHKAWVKFLARNRKYRKITHVIGDIDTYLAVESRLGRPGSNNYDPTLARIDPQALVMNVGFGNDVQWMIVDSAAEGGPVPANTVWALDASKAIVRVTNTAASYSASEQFALRRSSALRVDWSEAVYRMFGDSELKAFDKLTIA